MTPEELRATGRLATQAATVVTSHVEQVHQAIAKRAFSLTPSAAPARLLHDGIARGVYATVRGAERAAGLAADEVLRHRRPASPPTPAGTTVGGNLAQAALNAAVGHQLDAQHSALAIEMAVRVAGRNVPTRRQALATAFPAATGRLVVFLHGLTETEDAWRLHARRHYGDPDVCYGTRLADDLGYTPVYLRYNTGLHISDNGRRLARLLDELVAAWPVEVERIALVGHSMGGLVARSGCHYGEQSGSPWVARVRQVVSLGSPHTGAPLEKGAALLGRALLRLEDTRPWATLVNGRSVGIKDLRHGYLVDDDWRDCDVDTCPDDHRSDVPLLAGADHYLVTATVTRDVHHPAGRVVGDLLVQPASARGRHRQGRHIPFPLGNARDFGGMHHFHLLNHPAIYEALRAWLDPRPRAEPAS